MIIPNSTAAKKSAVNSPGLILYTFFLKVLQSVNVMLFMWFPLPWNGR